MLLICEMLSLLHWLLIDLRKAFLCRPTGWSCSTLHWALEEFFIVTIGVSCLPAASQWASGGIAMSATFIRASLNGSLALHCVFILLLLIWACWRTQVHFSWRFHVAFTFFYLGFTIYGSVSFLLLLFISIPVINVLLFLLLLHFCLQCSLFFQQCFNHSS